MYKTVRRCHADVHADEDDRRLHACPQMSQLSGKRDTGQIYR